MIYSRATWIECRKEYESKDTTVAALSKKFGMSASAIDRKLKKDEWIKLKVVKNAEVMAKAEDYVNKLKIIQDTEDPDYVLAHQEEHRKISVKNQAEAIAATARLVLAQQNLELAERIDYNDDYAVQKHGALVTANKNVDTSRQTGATINNLQQNNNEQKANITFNVNYVNQS